MNNKHILVIFSLIYIFIGISINYFVCNRMYNNIIEYYKYEYKDVLENIGVKFEKLSPDDIENSEILNEVFELYNGYGFVYRDNMVIYEMNLEKTGQYKNSTTRELFNDYSQDNGSNLTNNMTNILLKEEGIEFLTKNNDSGMEMIVWKNIDLYNKSYIIGVASPVSNILKRGDFYFYRNLFTAEIILNYVIFMIFYYVIIRQNKKIAA